MGASTTAVMTMTTMSRRSWSSAAALAAGAGVLSACAGLAGGGAPRAIKAPTTVSYMTDWASGPRLKIVQDGVALFQEKYPIITVDFQPTNEVLNKIITDLAAGTPADVILYAGPLDAYVDLMPFAKRDKLDLKQYLLLDPMLNANGTLLGLPFQTTMEPVWFCNRTLFQRDGAALPTEQWTWDSAAETARKLTRAGETWGLASVYEKTFEGLLRSTGGDVLSPDRKRATLDTAEAREAGQWLVDRIHRDRTLLPLLGAPELQPFMKAGQAVAFQSGRIAMGEINQGWVGNLEASVGFTEFDWDVMPTPKAPRTGKTAPFLTDRPNGVTRRPSRTADQMDAAWLLAQFMSGPEVAPGLPQDPDRAQVPAQAAGQRQPHPQDGRRGGLPSGARQLGHVPDGDLPRDGTSLERRAECRRRAPVGYGGGRRRDPAVRSQVTARVRRRLPVRPGGSRS
jgi:ABC-type glycerol-3-phosphate transport system substrate-binding protein